MEVQGHTIVRRKAKDGNPGLDGKPGADGKPGKDANLLPWVEQWNNNKTLIGGEYVVSPKMFSGINTGTSENPILTGIAMGKDCLTMPDGSKRTGIFSLVNNEIVFELDPISKKYKFKGDFYTIPFHLNKDNILKYTIKKEINNLEYYEILFEKTGLNVQIDSFLTIHDFMLFNLPRKIEYEGAEFNICICAFSFVSSGIDGIIDPSNTDASNYYYIRTGITPLPFVQYKFKCIVFDPTKTGDNNNPPYPYELINGLAIEWLLIN